MEPKDPKNWYKVYQKLQRQGETARREQDAALVAVLNQKREEKDNNKMTFLNKVVDPGKKRPAATRSTIFSRAPDNSVMSFGSGSRTSTTTGKGLILKAKREARENSLFSARRNVLSTPTHLLGDNRPRSSVLPAPRAGTTFSHRNQVSTSATAPPRPNATSASIATSSAQPAKRPASGSVFISNKRPRFGKS